MACVFTWGSNHLILLLNLLSKSIVNVYVSCPIALFKSNPPPVLSHYSLYPKTPSRPFLPWPRAAPNPPARDEDGL